MGTATQKPRIVLRPPHRTAVAIAAAAAVASSGTAVIGARNLLSLQAHRVRQVIPKAWDIPPRADGVYTAGGGEVERWRRGVPFDVHLMVFGDSTAVGYGCQDADEVPGVMIARGLADYTGKRIRLSTKAIVGATSRGLSGQVDAMFVAGPPPDAAVIMIGANDITALNGVRPSARRLWAAVRRLRASGAVVVVGTCPDFGLITTIPQPLRYVARTRGLQLARAQAAVVRSAGGIPVPFSDLLAQDFRQSPELLFSDDMFHPSAAGYALAAKQLLPALIDALGEQSDTEEPKAALVSRSADSKRTWSRLLSVSRLWRRSTGVPAPVVVPTG